MQLEDRDRPETQSNHARYSTLFKKLCKTYVIWKRPPGVGVKTHEVVLKRPVEII